jgi:GTPase involved in cell partitioning and DNA repair
MLVNLGSEFWLFQHYFVLILHIMPKVPSSLEMDFCHAVMKINRLIHHVQNWAKKGKIPSSDAAWIISELETIRMKLVNKCWAEALAEKALALKAIAEAKMLGKDTTKAEAELIKVDRELAKAIQCINDGKYSQAIQHFKHAFSHSQFAVKKAYDPTWNIDYKDWIDELEEEDP